MKGMVWLMFSIEGKFFRTLTKMGDFLILGVLMVVGCLPIVTAGASLTATFYVALKLVKDEEGYVFNGYMKSFKQNFKQSFFMEIILLVIGFILYLDVQACSQWAAAEGSTVAMLFMYAAFGFVLIFISVILYAFPMLARFDNTVPGTLKNALLLCTHHLPQTFVMLIGTIGLVIFSLWFFTAFIITIPLIIYIDSYILARVFLKYMKNETGDAAGEDIIAENASGEIVSEENEI